MWDFHAGKCSKHGVDNVGTAPAALTAYLSIQQLKPDLVISLGTAGGFKAKGAQIGDVYISTAFANHDRHIPIPVSLSGLTFIRIQSLYCYARLDLSDQDLKKMQQVKITDLFSDH